MNSRPSASDDGQPVRGVQEPRYQWVPDYVSSAGQEAIELAAMAGLHLDPWQRLVLNHSLGERKDGSWAAFEVGLVVPRQSGKDACLEARELAGLYLLGERLLIHSAHQFDTSLEHFRRILYLIENTPDLERRVQRVSRSHGEEGIELKGGQRIRFRTRTKGGGRGFSGDFLALNEAMELPEATVGALLPTLSARPNPQVWYTGSPVDKTVHEHGIVLTRIRNRGLKGGDPALAYFEWSANAETLDEVTEEVASDPQAWAQANPGLGIRISVEHVEREQRSMDPRTFAVERLGVGDWPDVEGLTSGPISIETWMEGFDPSSAPTDPVTFAFDVSPDRGWTSIGVAGIRSDGLPHVEVADRKRGTGWVVDRLIGMVEKHEASAIVCAGSSPAASLVAKLSQALKDAGSDVEVVTTTAQEFVQACGGIYDACDQGTLRHRGTAELKSALRGSAIKSVGDSWAWSRTRSASEVSPLVAVTLALWGAERGSDGEGDEPLGAWA